MASTINAAVGGIILSSDSSGALDIQTGGVNAIQVSSAGDVTVPNLSATSANITTLTGTTIGTTATTQLRAASASITTLTATNFSATSITVSNVIAVSQGGTGQTSYTNGQLLIGNTTGNTLTKATLTAGSGITITNGAGSITITNSSTGGAQDFIVQSYGLV